MSPFRPWRRALRAGGAIGALGLVVAGALFATGVIGRREPFTRLREIPVRQRQPVAAADKLAPRLREMADDRLRRRDDTPLTVMLEMVEQVNLRELFMSLRDHRVLSRPERRAAVLRALSLVAARRREPGGIEPFLDELAGQGLVLRHDGFTVVNRVAVTLRAEALALIAERPDVARIVEERGSARIVPHETTRTRPPSLRAQLPMGKYAAIPQTTVAPESWAIDALECRKAWEMGFDGMGVVVGIIDTGVLGTHEQLEAGFRGGENSWYDPTGARTEPRDSDTHGTGVLSCAVGRNVAGKVIGVAPGATWIAALGMPGEQGNNVFLTAAADWMLMRGQPDVLICAFGFSGEEPFDENFVDIVDAWRAAEINVVFSAGNGGPGYATNAPPANIPNVYPAGLAPVSVGGIAQDMSLYRFSSEGPNASNMTTFPELVAPGDDLTIATPLSRTAVIRGEGTSMAAGYVAGLMALALQVNPDIHCNEMDAMLRGMAKDLGPTGVDNKFGRGIVTAPAVIEGARRLAADGHAGPTPPKL